MINSLALILAMQSLPTAQIEVATPNDQTAQRLSRIESLSSLQSQNKNIAQESVFSSDISSPSSISENLVEAYKTAVKRFMDMKNEADSRGIGSHLVVDPGKYAPYPCQVVSVNQSGIERVSDQKLNGYSSLIDCGDFFIDISITDLSYPTTPTQRVRLPDKYHKIDGGNFSVGFSTNGGKLRQDYVAIGKHNAIVMLSQSKTALPQSEVFDVSKSLISRILLDPPPNM